MNLELFLLLFHSALVVAYDASQTVAMNQTQPNLLKFNMEDTQETEDKDQFKDYEAELADDKDVDDSQYDDDANDDILSREGQPGWLEKMLKKSSATECFMKYKATVTPNKAKEMQSKPKTQQNGDESKRVYSDPEWQYDDAVASATATLTKNFNEIGPQAEPARKGLQKITGRLKDLGFNGRVALAKTLESAASNIGKFANAGKDPVGAIQAGLNMVSQFAALAGPVGTMVSVALSFVSGILSLFGVKQPRKKTMGEIVRKEIDEALEKFYDKTLKNEAEGISSLFARSKAYVDHIVRSGQQLTKDQYFALKLDVPVWSGVTFLGKLWGEIKSLLQNNERKKGKKVLRYIEMYTKLCLMKDMINQQVAAMLPEELAPNQGAMFAVQKLHRQEQKRKLKFLFEAYTSGKEAARFFDPDVYSFTYAYIKKFLKIPDFDRSLAGKWCLTPSISNKKLLPLTWFRKYKEIMKDKHPYISLGNDGCFWKLIPHEKNIFTIQNTYKCPKHDYCNDYLSFDILGGPKNRATVEDDPDWWEITGGEKKSIRTKYGCRESPPHRYCNRELAPRVEGIPRWSGGFFSVLKIIKVTTVGIKKNRVGKIWYLTKKPMESSALLDANSDA